MTVNLKYRDLQRMTTGALIAALGNEVGYVSANGQVLFKIRVCQERDLGVSLDSQKTGQNEATGLTVKKEGQNDSGGHDSQSQSSVKPLQQMINRMQGHDSQSQKRKIVDESTTHDSQSQTPAPWYNPQLHTTGDTVRMRDSITKAVKVVTL